MSECEHGQTTLEAIDSTGHVDKLHKKNSNGSCTPAVDGERVYVAFADDSQYVFNAYDFDGNLVWTKDLGTFESQHGQGQSPMIIPQLDLVILANDQQGPSYIHALNRKTGEEVWRSERTIRKTAYATPMLLDPESENPQLICISGATGVAALDAKTGQELWQSGALPLRAVASPVLGHGIILASCGQGGVGKHMVAVEPTSSNGKPGHRIRWERKEMLPYVPTPVVHGDHFYIWTDQGIAVCLDPATGETVNRQRTGGGTFSSSPILLDGKLYNISETGEVVVVSATPELEVLGHSQLGDHAHATPAVANGRLYLRGFHRLACLNAG